MKKKGTLKKKGDQKGTKKLILVPKGTNVGAVHLVVIIRQLLTSFMSETRTKSGKSSVYVLLKLIKTREFTFSGRPQPSCASASTAWWGRTSCRRGTCSRTLPGRTWWQLIQSGSRNCIKGRSLHISNQVCRRCDQESTTDFSSE